MKNNMIKNYLKKIKKLEDFILEKYLKYYLKQEEGTKTISRRKKSKRKKNK